MKRPILPLVIALIAVVFSNSSLSAAKPNILFIAIDDLNDWVGPLQGHPLVKTPNMDRLAARGTTFLNSHCQSPLCNPSRTSLLTGLRPSTTGIYGLAPWFRTVPELKDRTTLPQYFRQHGYRLLTAGKIYHGNFPPKADRAEEFNVYGPPSAVGARPEKKLVTTAFGNHALVDWGTFPHRDEDKGDWKIASWAVEQLQSLPAERPFFLSVGFFLPHVPCYVTQKWFDLYPDDDSILPPVKFGDRDDTPRFSWYLHWVLPEVRLKWLRNSNQWHNLVRSYLASVSFVDSQVGRVLDALEKSPHASNTIVVLWSDHGWHLGEKLITGKNTLWKESTRVPLIFAGPGVSRNAKCNQPVELLDIYPTLVELCGLPAKESFNETSSHDGVEGHSLLPQLRDAAANRPWPAITTHNQGNHSVRSEYWRYIRYADGSEELYDTRKDPYEWNNLASRSSSADILAEHRRWLPKRDVPPAPGSASRILTYNPTTKAAVWEGNQIGLDDPIPME